MPIARKQIERLNYYVDLAKSDVGFEYDTIYQNTSPVQTDDEDTGIRQDSLPPNTELQISIIFLVNSSQVEYAITINGENDRTPLSEDIRLLRTGEPVTGGGDVAFGAWLDSSTGTYHYSLDVDGGGKTLQEVVMSRKTLKG